MMSTAVVYHKQLGDMLLLQPVIERLAELGTPVDVFTLPGHEPLVNLMPGASWPTPEALKERRYGRVIAFDQSSKSVMRALRLNAIERFLVTRADVYIKWHHRLLFDNCLADGLCVRYVSRYYHEMLFGLSSTGDFKPPRLEPPPHEWGSGVHSPGVLINPVSAWERKCWTVEGWRQVIEAVLSMNLGPVTLTGGDIPWHQSTCREICEGFPADSVRNMAGQTTLKGFLAMLAASSIVLTVDGAASHIAQAFGRPTVVLFGPSKPQMWHYETPLNRAIHSAEYSPLDLGSVAHLPTDKLPPTSIIPPERVVNEARQVLTAFKQPHAVHQAAL